MTYAATHASKLQIPEDRLGSIEVHIHVPAGRDPEGRAVGRHRRCRRRSVSAMSGRPVRKDVAMTGEITLRGRVLPIGGVKEKVLGAHRAGIIDDHSAEGQRGGHGGHSGGRPQAAHVPLREPRSTRCSRSRLCRPTNRVTTQPTLMEEMEGKATLVA